MDGEKETFGRGFHGEVVQYFRQGPIKASVTINAVNILMALYRMEFKYLHVAEIKTERLFGSDQDGQEQDGVHRRDSWSSFNVLEVKPERPD